MSDFRWLCAQDHHPTLWFSEDGARIGTYIGHNGAVNTCDVSSRFLKAVVQLTGKACRDTTMHENAKCQELILVSEELDVCFAVDSTRLLTGSSDSSAKLWEVETGRNVFTFKYKAPCRAVSFSIDERLAALSTDPFMATEPVINIVRLSEDPSEQSDEPVQQLTGFSKKINRVTFTDLNTVLISAGEDGIVRRWDVEVSPAPSINRFCSIQALHPRQTTNQGHQQSFKCCIYNKFWSVADWQGEGGGKAP